MPQATQTEFAGMPLRRAIKPTILRPGADVDAEAIKVGGELLVKSNPDLPQLLMGDNVIVTITGMDGQKLAEAVCTLKSDGFKTKSLTGGIPWTVKAWTAVPE